MVREIRIWLTHEEAMYFDVERFLPKIEGYKYVILEKRGTFVRARIEDNAGLVEWQTQGT